MMAARPGQEGLPRRFRKGEEIVQDWSGSRGVANPAHDPVIGMSRAVGWGFETTGEKRRALRTEVPSDRGPSWRNHLADVRLCCGGRRPGGQSGHGIVEVPCRTRSVETRQVSWCEKAAMPASNTPKRSWNGHQESTAVCGMRESDFRGRANTSRVIPGTCGVAAPNMEWPCQKRFCGKDAAAPMRAVLDTARRLDQRAFAAGTFGCTHRGSFNSPRCVAEYQFKAPTSR